MPFLPVIGQWFEFMHPPAAYFAYLLAVVAAFIGDYRTGEAGLLCSHGARKWTAGKCENRVRFWSSAGPVLKLTEHSEIHEVPGKPCRKLGRMASAQVVCLGHGTLRRLLPSDDGALSSPRPIVSSTSNAI
jgi:hypothetical protein